MKSISVKSNIEIPHINLRTAIKYLLNITYDSGVLGKSSNYVVHTEVQVTSSKMCIWRAFTYIYSNCWDNDAWIHRTKDEWQQFCLLGILHYKRVWHHGGKMLGTVFSFNRHDEPVVPWLSCRGHWRRSLAKLWRHERTDQRGIFQTQKL